MTTLVLSSATASQQRVQILPRQPIYSNTTDMASFHPSLENISFPQDIFDFEDLVQVDDLLTELGMNPPTNTEYDAIPSFSNSNSNDHTATVTLNGISDSHQALETNNNDADPYTDRALPVSSAEASTTSNSGSVVRTVSYPSLPLSVPNPMRNYAQAEPFATVSSTKAYAPLLPNPTPATTTKPATATATNDPTTTTAKITSKATIAKSSSIPSLLPSSYLPKTSPATATATATTTRVRSATINVRKRKLSRKETELHMSSEELEERRERNRSHAKKSRQRKKALTELLQESVQMLQEENQKLRESLNAQMGPQHAERWWEGKKDEEKISFLDALKNPKYRFVDAAGLAFLKKLPNRLPMHNDDGEASDATATVTTSAN